MNFLNPEGHQNPISDSKVTAILLKGWSFSGGGSALQPAQQACFNLSENELLVFAIKRVFFSFLMNIFEGNQQKRIDKSFPMVMSKICVTLICFHN